MILSFSLLSLQQMDPRSLLLYRLLLSLYLCQDLMGRLLPNGWHSLQWYISEPTDTFNDGLPPIFDPTDEQSNAESSFSANLYNYWCFRGTPQIQVVLMTLHALLILAYAIATASSTNSMLGMAVPTLLWISTVSLVCRAPPDNFLNDLGDILGPAHVFWTIFLPDLGGLASATRTTHDIKNNKPSSDDKQLLDTKPKSSPTILSSTSSSSSSSSSTLRQRRPSTINKENRAGTNNQQEQQQEHQHEKRTHLPVYHFRPVKGLPCLAISLQIVIVYLAIIYGRIEHESWWYPELSAVYYAFSCLRYTRPIMAQFAQKHVTMTRIMTLGTHVVELACPVLCFLAPYDEYRYDETARTYVRTYASWRAIPALMITGFHLTLWACIRIPALQIICASVPVVWIPGSFWDRITALVTGDNHQPSQHPHPSNLPYQTVPKRNSRWRDLTCWVRNAGLLVMIPSMLANFAVNLEWHVATGVMGQLSQLSTSLFMEQEWRIYKAAPGGALGMIITGYYHNAKEKDPRKDILAAWRTNDWSNRTDISFSTYAHWSAKINVNMSAQFGHWRIESFLTEADLQNHERYSIEWRRIDRWQYFVCHWANTELAKAKDPRGRISEIEMLYQFAELIPPEEPGRFDRTEDTIFTYSCEDEPIQDIRGRIRYPRSKREVFSPFTVDMLHKVLNESTEEE